MHILQTHELTHSYSDGETVLDGISLRVEAGSIYGFLGPNGAGKTTTLRLILGLLKKQHGGIEIFGQDFDSHRVESLRQIGSLIESPSIYSHLTAEENLRVLQKIYRCPRSRIGEVLEIVGLGGTGNKRAGQFSLGMKQRLSIAIALLNSPALLVLDEPTNGLDPNGMIEIRELLRRLNRERGISILISSHLLAEIDRLVSHIGIIHRGKMMFQGTLEELKEKQQQSVSVVFETSDSDRTREILHALHLRPVVTNGRCILPSLRKELIADINRRLVMKGIEVYEVSVVKNDLERIFLDLVSD